MYSNHFTSKHLYTHVHMLDNYSLFPTKLYINVVTTVSLLCITITVKKTVKLL